MLPLAILWGGGLTVPGVRVQTPQYAKGEYVSSQHKLA